MSLLHRNSHMLPQCKLFHCPRIAVRTKARISQRPPKPPVNRTLPSSRLSSPVPLPQAHPALSTLAFVLLFDLKEVLTLYLCTHSTFFNTLPLDPHKAPPESGFT